MTGVTAIAARDALRAGRVLPGRFEVEYVAADGAVRCAALVSGPSEGREVRT
jgi:hypothetical protein